MSSAGSRAVTAARDRLPATPSARSFCAGSSRRRAWATLGTSARFAGFTDALGVAIAELESGLLDPDDVDGDLADLYRPLPGGARSARTLGSGPASAATQPTVSPVELEAWDGRPVYAYGFEDLTAAQWRLLEAFAGRVEVTVSLPYEPGRAVFASLERTSADLARLADGRIEQLPARYGDYAHPALAHLERALFQDVSPPAPPSGGRGPVPRGSRYARDARARRRRDPSAAPRRNSGGGDPRRLPVARAVRAPLEAAFGALASRTPLDGSAAALPHAVRPRACSRCSASPGSAAGGAISSASSARRTRVCRARTPTSSKAGSADAVSARPSASRPRR